MQALAKKSRGSVRSGFVIACLLITACVAACGDDAATSTDDGDDEPSALGNGRRDSGAEQRPGSGGIGKLTDAGVHLGDGGGSAGSGASQGDGGVLGCGPSVGGKDECNGVDDDCDGEIDEDFVADVACDGTDGDLCADGVRVCGGKAGPRCDDDADSVLDLCNGLDDDCDPTTADGSDEPSFGRACDGDDSDLCPEGTIVCTVDGLACSDASDGSLDVCNGEDDDCDPATADGSAEPTLDQPCDGDDGDLCPEGVIACSGGELGCSDTSADKPDVCNRLDDDCDPSSADGSEDPLLGMPCDGADGDECKEGHFTCNGTLTCDDTTGTATESCNGADDDCDGNTDETFVRDSNPSCASASFSLGSVGGDAGTDVLYDSGYAEEWAFVTVREDNGNDSSSPIYLSATVTLTSAPGTDFDLFVYCDGCGGALAGSSETSGTADYVDVRAEDSAADDSFTIAIEVYHYQSTVCGTWSLTVEGNTTVDSAATCN